MNLYEELLNLAGVELDEAEQILLTEGIAELKRQYPNISDNDYQQLIRMDPTYKGGNEIGKFGRWILDLYNMFVKDRLAEEKYEKAKAYVAQHPEAKMPPAPTQKSVDKIEDFQKLPDLLSKFVKLAKDIKQPINSFKSVADLASAVRASEEKDVQVDEKAEANYKVFREAMSDGLKVVYQDNDWVIGIPETYESSSHFKDPVTDWCTAYPDMYEEYLNEFGGKYYIHLNKHTGDLYQLHAESGQFKDASDKEIDKTTFAKENPQLKSFYDKIIPMKYWQFWPLHNKTPTEAEQLAAVKQDGYIIRCIKNPSEQVQLAAVKQDGRSIQYIKNPSEQMQLAAVEQNGEAIRYIKTPPEQVQLAAVKQNCYAIQYIDNPSEEAQLAAVKKDWYAIQYIDNPSEEAQLAAVKKDGRAIKYIHNPSEQVQLAAVEENYWVIQYINNPSEQVQLAAVKKDGRAIVDIKNPSEQVQLAAVNQDCRWIRFITNPSEQVQLAAVNQDCRWIRFITNPSEQVQLAAVNQYLGSIEYIRNPYPSVIKYVEEHK
mgnify:CR=1 FL=1